MKHGICRRERLHEEGLSHPSVGMTPTGHERAAFAAMHGSLGLQRREFIGLLGGDAASPFVLAARKDGLGEEPCARSVLFCSVSQ